MNELPEERESLWIVAASPLIWAAHFLLCYATASIVCGRLAALGPSSLDLRAVVIAYTAIAAVGIALVAWRNAHGFDWSAVPHDFDTPHDRHRFLGFATVLLSGLSLVATLYVALTVVFIPGCR